MIKLLLKHKIFEECIEHLFNGLSNLVLSKDSIFVLGFDVCESHIGMRVASAWVFENNKWTKCTTYTYPKYVGYSKDYGVYIHELNAPVGNEIYGDMAYELVAPCPIHK